jgi:phosphoribosylaminoimidazole-succinocarboxamide synthase
MQNALIDTTNFKLPGQKALHHGKVRDIYDLGDKLALVSTDRFSAFDRNLLLIPDKGQLLSSISKWWFDQTANIIKNHVISYPDPNVLICKKYKVVPIEMVVRGYITGVTNTSLWHTYTQGQRDYGDFSLPDGLNKNDKLPHPVLTPTTKFEKHDRNLTPAQAVAEGLLTEKTWTQLQKTAIELFTFGQEMSDKKGLILVDTKYEFGLDENENIVLIDEIHTPVSSRYWLKDTYESRLNEGKEPDNYDKEFLRIWFNNQFDPYQDTEAPIPPSGIINESVRRYIYVYEQLTGEKFQSYATSNTLKRIEDNLVKDL